MNRLGYVPLLPDTFYDQVAPRICTNPHATERVVSAFLDLDVARNDAKGETPFESMTPFHALEAPSIVVSDYVRRISQYAFSSTACLLAAFHYVKRAVQEEPALAPTSLSVHRLLITAVVLAAKYFDDITYSMGYYAKVGGLPVKELAYLELRMLTRLNFRLHITPADFHTLEQDLIDALNYVPRTPIVFEAREVLAAANITSKRWRFCETMHDSDKLGLWRPHPDPKKPMLNALEMDTSPVNSPATSPRHETRLELDDDDPDDDDDDDYDAWHDYDDRRGSGAFNKQISAISTSTVSSTGSNESAGYTPKFRTHHAPRISVRRTFADSSAPASGRRCASELGECHSTVPIAATRTYHDRIYHGPPFANDYYKEQQQFEETVKNVTSKGHRLSAS